METFHRRDLLALPDEAFLRIWAEVFGQPPAILIDRADMVELLLDAVSEQEGAGMSTRLEESRRAA